MTTITEADVEAAALDWLSSLGWQVAHGRTPPLARLAAELVANRQAGPGRRLRVTLLPRLMSGEVGLGCPTSNANGGGSD